MRAMWKGSVAFGLVNVPIKLYAATEDHDVRFHQVHAADGGRIKMQRTCTVDGAPVDYKDLAKAYEAADGRVVIMDESDFESLPVPGVREIEVLEFVPSDQVDPVLFDRAYYLEPDAKAVKPYVLLRESLEATDRTAIARVVLRSKSQLAALRVRGDVIVLQTMLWPDEVREASFDVLDVETDLRPQELTMAASLIDSLSSDFDPTEYSDDYRQALLEVIDAKLAGGEGVAPVAAVTSGDAGDGLVLDLMAALRESVERSKGGRNVSAPEPEAATLSEAEPSAHAARAPRTSKPASSSASKSASKSHGAVKSTARTASKTTAKKAAPKKTAVDVTEQAPETVKAKRRTA
jgi:DNA end-binding protein Ku